VARAKVQIREDAHAKNERYVNLIIRNSHKKNQWRPKEEKGKNLSPRNKKACHFRSVKFNVTVKALSAEEQQRRHKDDEQLR
jgi:hypothetical protein